MAEHDTKVEISKEVLAPATEIREDLVATAVKFLQNEKVKNSPLSQKRAFLQRKGLTREEIDVAVSTAGVTETSNDNTAPSIAPVANNTQSALPLPLQHVEVSRWTKAREIVALVAMVTGISYAGYRIYQELIVPWLFRRKTTIERLEALEKVIQDSSDKLSAIETALDKQQEKLQILSHDVNSKTGSGMSYTQTVTGLGDLKTELVSIKGLLLNRRNFPPVPASTPSLPAWQLNGATNGAPGATGDASSNSNNKGSTSPTSSPTITLSPTPAPISPATIDTVAIETSANKQLDHSDRYTDSETSDSTNTVKELQGEVDSQGDNVADDDSDKLTGGVVIAAGDS